MYNYLQFMDILNECILGVWKIDLYYLFRFKMQVGKNNTLQGLTFKNGIFADNIRDYRNTQAFIKIYN